MNTPKLLNFYIVVMKKKKVKKTILFTSPTKRTKYLAINLNKDLVKICISKNYKSLIKEIQNDTDKWKDIPSSWNGIIFFVKTSILL